MGPSERSQYAEKLSSAVGVPREIHLQTFARPLAPALADPKKCELPTKISGQRRTARGIDMYTAI